MFAATDNSSTTSLIVTIGLTSIGWLAVYSYSRELARRKEELELVNKQLSEFYGPLYVACESGRKAYEKLLEKFGRKEIFEAGHKTLLPHEFNEWRIWLKNVFTPINELRERLVLEKAYLIREDLMPEFLVDVVTHAASYRVVLAKWQEGDFSEQCSLLDFPGRKVEAYARVSYLELKKKQSELIGIIERGFIFGPRPLTSTASSVLPAEASSDNPKSNHRNDTN